MSKSEHACMHETSSGCSATICMTVSHCPDAALTQHAVCMRKPACTGPSSSLGEGHDAEVRALRMQSLQCYSVASLRQKLPALRAEVSDPQSFRVGPLAMPPCLTWFHLIYTHPKVSSAFKPSL